VDGVKNAAGDIQVTHGRVIGIAVPMTLAYLTTPLVGIVDMAVIGQLGNAALLGGIAVGAIIFNIVFTSFNFLRSGTTGLTAQALGAGDGQEINDIAWRALGLGIAAGLIITLLQVPIFLAAMYFMGASDQVQAATSDYFYIRVLAAPISLANFAVLGWLLGLGRATAGLIIQTILNGTNMALCVWFVLYLDWGIAGAAWSTVIAETVGLAVGLVLVALRLGSGLAPRVASVISRDKVMRMLSLNRDIMIRSFALIFAFTMFTSIGARSGDVVLAANAVLMNFFLFSGFFLDGIATAAEQLVGIAVGARQRPAFEQTLRLTIQWGFGLAGALTGAYFFFGADLIDLVTSADDVRGVAREYLVWAIVTPIAGVLAFQMDGIFIGATWSRDMRNMMLASLAIYVISWWLLSPFLGNHGLWLALVIFLGIRGITLLAITKRRADETFGTAVKSA
jgi:MATE family, multidrug efflux pump